MSTATRLRSRITLRRPFRFWRGSPRGDRGQSAVEFALAAPVLIAFIMFIVDVGFLGFNYVSAANSVREGARCAAVGGTANAVATRVVTTAGNLSATVAVTPVAYSGPNIGADTTVSADFTYSFITPLNMLPGLNLGTLKFNKKAVMRMETTNPGTKTSC